MMEKIRVAANHIVVKIIFVLIILSFIFAGIGGIFSLDSGDDSQYIARVDGEGLSRAAFEAQAKVATDNAVALGNDNSLYADIRRGVLANQIDNYIAYQFSKSLNLKISNQQVKNIIRQQDVFFVNGRFNNQNYLELLALNGFTPDSYAEAIRGEFQQKQAMNALVYSDFALPVDSNISLLKAQTRTVYTSPLSLDKIDIDNEQFSDDDLFNYYNSHLDNFNSSTDTMKLATIRLPRVVVESKVIVTDEEVEDYYKKNKNLYIQDDMRAFSALELADIDEANEVHQALVDGADFKQLVQEKALFPSQRKTKGFLGWFKVSELPDFLMGTHLSKKGDISQPLLQESGSYLIVRLDDEKMSETMPFDLVAKQVKYDLIQSITDQRFQEGERKLQELVDANLSLDDIAKEMELEVEMTSWLNPQLAPFRFPQISEAAYSLLDDGKPTESVSGPIFIDEYSSFYVIKVSGFRPAGIPSFDSVKEQILNIMTRQAAIEKLQDEGNLIVNGLNTGDSDAYKKVSFSKKLTISRDSTELDKAAVDMIFSLVQPADNSSIHGVAFLPKNQAIIVALIKVDTPTELSDLSEDLRTKKINLVDYYLAHTLRSKVKIEIIPNRGM